MMILLPCLRKYPLGCGVLTRVAQRRDFCMRPRVNCFTTENLLRPRVHCFTTESTMRPTLALVTTDKGVVARTKNHLKSHSSILHHHYNKVDKEKTQRFSIACLPEIKSVMKPQLDELLTMLKAAGCTWEDIKAYKQVLLMTPTQYLDRISLLQQFSITRPTINQVVFTTNLMSCTVESLKRRGVYSSSTDVLSTLVSCTKDLHLPPYVVEGFFRLFQADPDATLAHYYLYFLTHYLSLRYFVPYNEVQEMLEAKWNKDWRPLSSFQEICDVIDGSLHWTFSDIKENPVVLSMNPKEVIKLIQEYPKIGVTKTIELLKIRPNLLLVPYMKLRRWLGILKSYGVTDFTFNDQTWNLFKNATAFHAVEKRLSALVKHPCWQEVIMISEHLFFALQHNEAMKKILMATSSGQDITNFSKFLEDVVHSRHDIRLWEVITFMANELDIQEHEARELLEETFPIRHGVDNAKMVLRLLLQYGFSKKQIKNGVFLLAFEYNIVEETLTSFASRPETQPFDLWKTHSTVLHMLGYCITKDYPFIGLPIKK